jgi:phage-related minor tail protein
VELDNRMKQLLRELGRAINEAVADSDRIAQSISRIKANGYDVFLMLDAVVGLNKRASREGAPQDALMTKQDRRFLKSLKIRLDEEAAAAEADSESRLAITPQDVKFLKSLRIDVDDLR